MKTYPIGVLIPFGANTDIEHEFQKAKDLELDSCQLCIWDATLYENREYAERIRSTAEKMNFTVSALWAGWSGPCEWNFTGGPATIGLVPEAYRSMRLKELKAASDFAEWIGVKHMITHVGFIPENPDHPDFNGVVTALRWLCGYMKKKGQTFLFETGQETPVTMLRTIQAIGTGNLGINFDTANLILYGKANPLDALDVFGQYVKNTHIKDGLFPTDGMALGKQMPVGEGRADVEGVIRKLTALGYDGPMTIEREISGDQQIKDIKNTRDMLREIYQRLD